ncbi:Leucine-rich protein [Bacillus sp. THAF10]|uniref:PucR family transcriptional regulator n=1 Tax=Bacillus sp. THAF10 TaxID=2587848 RepID=UPI0012685BE6|nr:helix-turn-helix domain-containing protein [Bacillus sp. THAF10]QFT88236.1 Leucine-rich protein [Bacillus sp. THAF10]
MDNRLEQLFPHALIKSAVPHSFSDYVWFLSSDDEYIGIEKKAISEKETLLIGSFLQKVEKDSLEISDSEKSWFRFLLRQGATGEFPKSISYDRLRFIHFQFSERTIQKNEWWEALVAFFDKTIEVIWDSPTSGVIIEPYLPDSDDSISFSDLADTIATDFYTNLKLYIGPYHLLEEALPNKYEWEKSCFQLSQKGRKQRNIHTFEDAMPYVLTQDLNDSLQQQIHELFQPILLEEQDLIYSIKAYIENNLNVSLTSKKLFMHRNTLQYRIDKFIERTGIDIKHFTGALAAFLAIIILEKQGYGSSAPTDDKK